MNDTRELLSDLSDESDLCRNDGVPEIADLLDRAIAKINELAGRASMAKVPEGMVLVPINPPSRAVREVFELCRYDEGITTKDEVYRALVKLLSALPKDDAQAPKNMITWSGNGVAFPSPQADIGVDEWLESQDFYEAMQGYRCAPMANQWEVIANFENVKRLIREHFASPQPTPSIPAAQEDTGIVTAKGHASGLKAQEGK